MPQLVGTSCAVCSGRIPSELDASFCPGCRHPVHDRCRVANPAASRGTCADCGADLGAAARAAADRERREAEARRAVVQPPLEVERMLKQLRTVKAGYDAVKSALLLIGGLCFAIGAGISLIASGERWPGIVLMVGVPGALAVFIFAGLRRAARR